MGVLPVSVPVFLSSAASEKGYGEDPVSPPESCHREWYPVMENRSVLRGIATITVFAADLAAARQWYTECTGISPYFERPGYVEFRLGDYQQELGLIDQAYAPVGMGSKPAGAVVYWQVEDVAGTRDRLLAMGARDWEPVRDRGKGFITASVVDPFGNILGLMYNPHYLEVRERLSGT